MADRVILPLPGIGTLVLDGDTYRAALAEGARLTETSAPSPSASTSKLLSAEELEASTGVPASWFATQARERRIPFRKLGRYVRFSYEELMACEAFQRRAIPAGQMNCTGSQNRNGRASD